MDASNQLKQVGLKVTESRLKIIELLSTQVPHHLSAESIHEMLQEQKQDIAMATVYRVLSQLEEVGLLVRHRFDNDTSVYELTHKGHHDHLVCTDCGIVKEFCCETIEKKIDQVAKNAGFVEQAHQLTVYGLCEKCAA